MLTDIEKTKEGPPPGVQKRLDKLWQRFRDQQSRAIAAEQRVKKLESLLTGKGTNVPDTH